MLVATILASTLPAAGLSWPTQHMELGEVLTIRVDVQADASTGMAILQGTSEMLVEISLLRLDGAGDYQGSEPLPLAFFANNSGTGDHHIEIDLSLASGGSCPFAIIVSAFGSGSVSLDLDVPNSPIVLEAARSVNGARWGSAFSVGDTLFVHIGVQEPTLTATRVANASFVLDSSPGQASLSGVVFTQSGMLEIESFRGGVRDVTISTQSATGPLTTFFSKPLSIPSIAAGDTIGVQWSGVKGNGVLAFRMVGTSFSGFQYSQESVSIEMGSWFSCSLVTSPSWREGRCVGLVLLAVLALAALSHRAYRTRQ